MKTISNESAEAMINEFLETAGVNDLAFIVSKFCTDEQIKVVGEDESSNIFCGGEIIHKSHFEIPAKAWSDDYVIEVEFDAEKWFEQASDKEIVNLAECGWMGDYPADNVAHFMADHNRDLLRMFKYISLVKKQINGDTMGFECSVELYSAMTWLRNHKPSLAIALVENPDIITS